MTTVLVTGGTGFIGRHLVSALAASGHEVRVLDVQKPASPLHGVSYAQASVLDPQAIDDALDGVDQVYHLAGLPGMWLPDKAGFHAVNCRGTETVLEGARRRNVTRFLHCSTESILFGPSPLRDSGEDRLLSPDDMPGPYTRSKLLAEQAAAQAAQSGFSVVIASPTMPIGHHDNTLTPPAAMLRHFLRGRFHLYLDFIVNLVDVRDVAAGLMLAMERGRTGERYILGGESIRLKTVLDLLAGMSGQRSLRVPIPGRMAEAATTILELVADRVTKKPPSGTAEGVRIALRSTALSIDKARRELGYSPRAVEPALRDTIAHLLNGRDRA